MKALSQLRAVVLSFMMLTSSVCYALEVETHQNINEYIARNSINGFSLGSYMKNNLGIEAGITASYDLRETWEWLRDGGYYEDIPAWYLKYLRSVNHFHNPLTDSGYAGFWGTGVMSGMSSIQWALLPKGAQSPGGYYSWHDVRGYDYKALTSVAKADRDAESNLNAGGIS